ncbi:MAG: hypothetical protein O6826_01270 [Acidobacteria bacterium]|nr:hypothetical protein [Acidobacteriota bacterium]
MATTVAIHFVQDSSHGAGGWTFTPNNESITRIAEATKATMMIVSGMIPSNAYG